MSVEPFHLFRYLDEQAYRFNMRKENDGERFIGVAKSVLGRRITYSELTGKTGPAADPYRRKQWRGKRQSVTLLFVKSPKVEDLKFEPGAAFDRLRKMALGVLAVTKKEMDRKIHETNAWEAPPCGGAFMITRENYFALSPPAFAL